MLNDYKRYFLNLRFIILLITVMSYFDAEATIINFLSEGLIGSSNNSKDRTIIEKDNLATNRPSSFIDGDSLLFSGNSLIIYTNKAVINNVIGDDLCIYGNDIIVEGQIELGGVLVLKNNTQFVIKPKNNFTVHIIKDLVLSQGNNILVLDSSAAISKISAVVYPNPDLQLNSFTLNFQGDSNISWYGSIGTVTANAPITQLNTRGQQIVAINNTENLEHEHVVFVQNANFAAQKTIINSSKFYGAVDKLGLPISDAIITVQPQAHLILNNATTRIGTMNVLANSEVTINSEDTSINYLRLDAGTVKFINSQTKVNNLILTNTDLNIGLSSLIINNLISSNSRIIIGVNVENNRLSYGHLVFSNNRKLSSLPCLNLVLSANQLHIPDETTLTLIDWGLKPKDLEVNILSDLPFSKVRVISEHNKLKLRINTDTDKLQQLVHLAGTVSENAVNAVKLLTSKIDEYLQVAEILHPLQQTKDNPVIHDLLDSFTDNIENSTIAERVIEDNLVQHGFETILKYPKQINKDIQRVSLWNRLIMASSIQYPASQQRGYQGITRGMIWGLNYNISEKLSFGLALNFNDNSFFYHKPKERDTFSINNQTFYLYGTYHLTNNLWVSSVFNYGKNDIHSRHLRRVNLNEQKIVSSDYFANAFGGLTQVNYCYPLNKVYTLYTNLGLSYISSHEDSYLESGAGNWNFKVNERRKTKAIGVLGMSILGDYEFFHLEIYFNTYQIIGSKEDVSKYRFYWLSEQSNLINEKVDALSRQHNLGINLNIQLDRLKLKLGSELKFADHYQVSQYTLMFQVKI